MPALSRTSTQGKNPGKVRAKRIRRALATGRDGKDLRREIVELREEVKALNEEKLKAEVEFKQIERSLRRSGEHLRLALQCASAGAWEVDLTSGAVLWSEQILALGTDPSTGAFTVDQLIDRIHPNDRKRARKLIQRIMIGQTNELREEFRMLAGAGFRWVALLGCVIQEADGTGRRVMGIGMDITERKEVEATLGRARGTLEQVVKERTAELRDANARLKHQIKDRRQLEEHILEVAEREQSRIGQDLHDSLGQQLTGIVMFNSVLRDSLTQQALPEAKTVERVGTLLDEALVLLRRIILGLHPVAAEPNGLMSGLRTLAESVCELYGVDCRFACPEAVLVHDNSVATHLYRIAQEAVGNACRHGKAQHITVGLRDSDSGIVLEIRDDGSGIAKRRKQHGGLGLQIMKSRAEAMGGDLQIVRLQRKGTLIRCSVPESDKTKCRP